MRTPASLLLAIIATAPFVTGLAQAGCEPTVLQGSARFPVQSQLRGQQGIVVVAVKVDESGRVTNTQLVRGSGHRRLDSAAAASIRDTWVFDVARCARAEFPLSDIVAVEYRNEEFGAASLAKNREQEKELSASLRSRLVVARAKN